MCVFFGLVRFRTKRYLYEKYSRLHVEVYAAIKTSSNVKISAIFICSSANAENVDVEIQGAFYLQWIYTIIQQTTDA